MLLSSFPSGFTVFLLYPTFGILTNSMMAKVEIVSAKVGFLLHLGSVMAIFSVSPPVLDLKASEARLDVASFHDTMKLDHFT